MLKKRINRRTFLRGAGVAVALPLLGAMTPGAYAVPVARRRMVAILTGLGLDSPMFYPREAGRNYTLSPYLEVLREFRDEFTVFSGVSHPDVDGGHSAESSYLTAAPHPQAPAFRNTISLDQFAAERLGNETRFASLTLGTGNNASISWSRNGVQIPADIRPSEVFARLFLEGTPEQVRTQVRRLREGQSVMDAVRDQAKDLQGELGPRDRARLDEYFTAVREVEQRLVQGQEWARRPKPRVSVPPIQDVTDRNDAIGRVRAMYDLMHLAIQTDSTRILTLHASGANGEVPPIPGVTEGWHNLSHSGQDPAKLAQLRLIEIEQVRALRGFLTKLKDTREESDTLLDRTMVLFGSNLGSASGHGTKNMPMLLAGGGFRHGQHLAFDRVSNAPLCKVYVSMLQRLGLEVATFASGNGTMRGLEMR
jgi:hypothetical protein